MAEAEPSSLPAPLTHLEGAIPAWLTHLKDLEVQIIDRRDELAALSKESGYKPRLKKKTGSTESLRPTDEPLGLQFGQAIEDSPPNSPILTRSSIRRKKQKRASESLDDVASDANILPHGQTARPSYRTRSMIIVYYDSRVQEAFEYLVREMSSTRSMIRKERREEKMRALFKKPAFGRTTSAGQAPSVNSGSGVDEDIRTTSGGPVVPGNNILEADDDTDSDDELFQEMQPRMLLARTRASQRGFVPRTAGSMSPPATVSVDQRPASAAAAAAAVARASSRGARSLPGEKSASSSETDMTTVWDAIDNSLDTAQNLCEKGAHQFLRDGDCEDEIEGVKTAFAEIQATVGRELCLAREKVMTLEPAGQESQSISADDSMEADDEEE